MKRIFIDGLSGMAQGLFATLIIGTIIQQIGLFVGGDYGNLIYMIGKVAADPLPVIRQPSVPCSRITCPIAATSGNARASSNTLQSPCATAARSPAQTASTAAPV